MGETMGGSAESGSDSMPLPELGYYALSRHPVRPAQLAAEARFGIATAATNHHTRHPVVTATMGATLAELSGGRFALGLSGRGLPVNPGATERVRG